MASINTETEHFSFGIASGDLKPTHKRNVQREVKGGDILDQQSTIDAFEMSKGILRKPKVDMAEFQFQNIVLDPEKDVDNKMLNQLLNDDKYMITYYKDNWTPQGTYRVFVIYGKKKKDE